MIEQQRKLEVAMFAHTKGKQLDAWFRDTNTGLATDNSTMRDVLKQWLPDLALYIELDEIGNRSPARAVKKLEPMAAAYIALHRVMAEMMRAKEFTKVAARVGVTVEREIAIKADESMSAKIEKRTKGKPAFIRERIIKNLIAENATDEWTPQQRVQVGAYLIGVVEEVLGIVKRVNKRKGKRTVAMLEFSSDMIEELDALTESIALDSMEYWPMVIPPRKWKSTRSGAYVTSTANRGIAAIRRKNSSKLDAIDTDADMGEVYEAMNSIQETAWMVNRTVYDTVRACLDNGSSLPLFRRASDLAKPEEGSEKRKWAEYFENVEAVRSRFMLSHKVLSNAERFKDSSRLFFPHNMDWRGRLYPIPSGLSPQGNDLSQGLLTFSTSKPLGADGRYWLAIHGANAFGHDKLPLDERAEWAELAYEDVAAIALDPIRNSDLWTAADKPYQYLAWALEWDRVVNRGATDSRLPVKMDATCSGIQHLSAIARDPSTARAVNLSDSSEPSDVYGDVAAEIIRTIKPLADGGDEMAARWIAYGINRKTAKRATMTLPYGSTMFSAKDYVYEDVSERILDKGATDVFMGIAPDGKNHLRFASAWLTKHLWQAINDTVPGARETMSWLQGKAKVASKDGVHMEWTTPDGFPVVQNYRHIDTKDAQIEYLGKRVRMSTAVGESELDVNKQRNGMAPNFIHSMDAAALRRYVVRAKDWGVSSHSMIHDSFGTHAGDAGTMQRVLREAFVELYGKDNGTCSIMEWLESNGLDAGEALEDRGFDVNEVLNSTYFFS